MFYAVGGDEFVIAGQEGNLGFNVRLVDLIGWLYRQSFLDPSLQGIVSPLDAELSIQGGGAGWVWSRRLLTLGCV